MNQFPDYDAGTFAIGAMVPLVASVLLPSVLRNKIFLYSSLAYYWALVEDGPVYLDSVFTWPEVTRYNPIVPHLFLEALYHALTAAFMILALREASRGLHLTSRIKVLLAALFLVSFGLAYMQNIPLTWIQGLVDTNWFGLDIFEHVASVVVFVSAVAIALNSQRNVSSGPALATENSRLQKMS